MLEKSSLDLNDFGGKLAGLVLCKQLLDLLVDLLSTREMRHGGIW